jgi:hypothetical protein
VRYPGFIGSSNTLQSVNAACERTVNLYPEINEQKTAAENEIGALFMVPGLRLAVDLGSMPIRGMWTDSSGKLWAVSGYGLHSISAVNVATSVGALRTLTGPVSMADNVTQLCVVDGRNGYIVTLADNTFGTIPKTSLQTGDGFKGATRVSFIDNYFVFNEPGTGRMYYTAIADGFDINGLDFWTAEGLPDNVRGHIVTNRDIIVGGDDSVEVYYNSSGSDNAFVRREGAFIEFGLASPFSLQKLANTVLWLGAGSNGSGVVWQLQGYQPVRVSTHAVEQALMSYGDLSDATAWTYADRGHQFYCLNVPGAPVTHCLDVSTGLWCERMDWVNGHEARFRAENHAFAYGKHYVGDWESGKIYTLDPDWPYFDTSLIHVERTSPHLVKGLTRMRYDSFQLDMEVGNIQQQASIPTLVGETLPTVGTPEGLSALLVLLVWVTEESPYVDPTDLSVITVNGDLISESNATGSGLSPFASVTTLDGIAAAATDWFNLVGKAVITWESDHFLLAVTPAATMALTKFTVPTVIDERWAVAGLLGLHPNATLNSSSVDGILPHVEPVMSLQYSDDGGHTWSDEQYQSIGKTGEWAKPVIWRRLGSGRNRVFRVKGCPACRLAILGAEIHGQQGVS